MQKLVVTHIYYVDISFEVEKTVPVIYKSIEDFHIDFKTAALNAHENYKNSISELELKRAELYDKPISNDNDLEKAKFEHSLA